jgi:diguanylate cyclase (GGDEF)-like protein
LQQVRALRGHLVRDIKMTQGGTLEAALYRMETSFVAKEDLVEQFKSENALLHNSLRYFPTAVAEFNALLRGQRASDPRIDRLLTDILRFHLMPETDIGARIAAAIGEIDRAQSRYPELLREPLSLLLRHARLILRQRVVEDELMHRIAAAPTADAIDDLSDALDREFAVMMRDRQAYRTYLFAYSGLLLFLLAYAAWRLMHSYHLIAQVNKRLQAANDTLERRVAERTAELERQSAQLAELATHDMLTGLINRRHLMTELAQALQRAQRRGWVVALMFIDLDGFKEINDTLGHAAGDQVLKEVAARVGRHVRKEDAMARLGGDEFVILLSDVNTQEGAARVAEAALDELRQIAEIDGYPVRISASIGISSVRGANGVDALPEALLNQADHAMYQAKQQGKNRYCFNLPGAWPAQNVVTA